MRCGACGSAMRVTKVSYSSAKHVRRRRKCTGCGAAYTTREVFDGGYITGGGVVMPNSNGGEIESG